jgi:hypothetical protein
MRDAARRCSVFARVSVRAVRGDAQTCALSHRYMARVHVPRVEFQLLGASCVFIAAKVVELVCSEMLRVPCALTLSRVCLFV